MANQYKFDLHLLKIEVKVLRTAFLLDLKDIQVRFLHIILTPRKSVVIAHLVKSALFVVGNTIRNFRKKLDGSPAPLGFF